jgi:hypothetical protein
VKRTKYGNFGLDCFTSSTSPGCHALLCFINTLCPRKNAYVGVDGVEGADEDEGSVDDDEEEDGADDGADDEDDESEEEEDEEEEEGAGKVAGAEGTRRCVREGRVKEVAVETGENTEEVEEGGNGAAAE